MGRKLLDLFCGAGGAGKGYEEAGFDVTGVDVDAQALSYNPHDWYRKDALEFLDKADLSPFAVIHASPPCQAYSTVSGRALKGRRGRYPDLIGPVRERLESSGLPYVIENVEGAPLLSPVRLCGSMFGLDVRRHRLFEFGGLTPPAQPPCDHSAQLPRFRSLDSRQKTLATVVGVHGHLNYPGELELRQKAMGIDWMPNKELTQAIPPAYTKWIGIWISGQLEG